MTADKLEAHILALDFEINFIGAWQQLWDLDLAPEAVTCAAYNRMVAPPKIS